MKAPSNIVPKIVLPDDVVRWSSAVDADPPDFRYEPRTEDSPPSVILHRRDLRLVRVSGEMMRDGLHIYATSYPDQGVSPLHLALRSRPVREMKMAATAAVLAAVALHFNREPVAPVVQADWLRRVQSQIVRALRDEGLEALRGISPALLAFVRECMRLVDRVMRKDVEEALGRVKAEFQLLVDHVDEADVLRLWREVVVEKTHEV